MSPVSAIHDLESVLLLPKGSTGRESPVYMMSTEGLEVQLCTSPVTSLSVVSDFVASPHAYPLWNGTILLLFLSKLLLDLE